MSEESAGTESETWYPLVSHLKARQVTEENLDRVARWCHGRVRGKMLPRSQQYVQIDLSRGGEDEANVGDWIVLDSVMEFRVLSDKQIRKGYEYMGKNWP